MLLSYRQAESTNWLRNLSMNGPMKTRIKSEALFKLEWALTSIQVNIEIKFNMEEAKWLIRNYMMASMMMLRMILFLILNSRCHLIRKLNIKKISRKLKLKQKKIWIIWKNLLMDKLIISKFTAMVEMNLYNLMIYKTYCKIKKRFKIRKKSGF